MPKIRRGRSGEEKVIFPRFKFQPSRLGRERSEREGEQLGLEWGVAEGDHVAGVGVGHAAEVVIGPGHEIDDVALNVFSASFLGVKWADQVGLVVDGRVLGHVDVDEVLAGVVGEDGVGCVPVDVMHLALVPRRNGRE